MDQENGYNDSNRAFLQAFLARSFMTFEEAKPVLAAVFSVQETRKVHAQDVSQEDFNSYISAANAKLSPLDLEIRSSLHQITRERTYALVNTTSDSLTQFATTYTPDEIAYIKRLLDSMFDGQNNRGRREAMCLGSMEAVQLVKAPNRRGSQHDGTQVTGLTIREGEDVLHRLVDEGWLEESRKKFYCLSPRALMELKGWLVDTYNDPGEGEDEDSSRTLRIKACHACKDIITMGQRCPNFECPCRLHDNCVKSFFRIHQSQDCPICQTQWNGKCFVGERAITTSEAYLKGKRRSTTRPHDEPDDDEDDR